MKEVTDFISDSSGDAAGMERAGLSCRWRSRPQHQNRTDGVGSDGHSAPQQDWSFFAVD
jgi:hypothetical protein